MIHRDRLVLLSFMNPIGNLSTLTGPITPQPFITMNPEEGANENFDEFTTPTPSITSITHMALPDVVDTRNEPNTVFSTVLYPVVTNSSLFRIISSTISAKTAATSTEATSATLKMTALPKNNTARRPTTRPIIRLGSSKSRSKAKNYTRIFTTVKPSRTNGGNMTVQSMPLIMNSLADLDHPENLNLELQASRKLFIF